MMCAALRWLRYPDWIPAFAGKGEVLLAVSAYVRLLKITAFDNRASNP